MQAVLIVIAASLLALTLFFIIENNKKGLTDKVKRKGKKETRNKHCDEGLIDYETYFMSRNEKLFYILIAAVVVYIVGFVFYRSHIISVLLMPLAFLYPRIKKREIIDKRKNDLIIQFKEALYALSTSLAAGKSIEMAFKDALRDLAILYPDPNTYIIKEFQYIVRRLEMNETIEDVLENFAVRTHLEDVRSFVDVFVTCKRTGGNIVEIIKSTSNVIADKIHIKQDIEIMLAQKKFEQRLLNIIPIFLILILSSSAKDYMQPVFTTILGRAMMTISIVLLGVSYFISKKIMDIEV